MGQSAEGHSEQIARLDQVLAEYSQRLNAGETADREAIIRQHPDLADDLRAYFQVADQAGQEGGTTAPMPVLRDAPTR